ncbi:MAG: radical SAM protein [Phycisphaerae bacterium]|nr:radical SAM protein [Phycisphaerae bacterium]
MELPRRTRGDELLAPGALLSLRRRIRRIARDHDLTSVVACAFDHRTRMLPFIYADIRMAPAGVRAIGAAMADVGFEKTRIVLQQWNRKFRPSQMRVDGGIPDIFMVSSMQLHTAACKGLIRDACQIASEHRPLIIAGGPKVIYEPWDVFGTDPKDPWSTDVAVTGEEYVLLNLIETLLTVRSGRESIRATFLRARDSGALDTIPGLVYARSDGGNVATELIDTGIQRLVGDLDELPHAALGYRLLEPPSRAATLSPRALSADQVRRYSPIGSLVMTFGCKFACPYCPIPAYNQRQHRVKSGERIADEMTRIQSEFGLRFFFGADDNFFNCERRTLEIVETLAQVRRSNRRRRGRFRWATEATVHDTLKIQEHLPLVRKAGAQSLWVGVEDMTATLIKKGQSVDKTSEAFRLLKENSIHPMPMMMHHDEQPLISFGPKPYGLLNQVRLLRKAGSVSMQVLMLVPATGSQSYVGNYTSGMAFESVGGRRVEEYMLGGNYVVASRHRRPWRKQINILLAYAYFYNPMRLLRSLVRPVTRLHFADAIWQVLGMWGLAQTARKTFGWALRLRFGKIRRKTAVPVNSIPMRAVDGSGASHAIPVTPATRGTRAECPAGPVDSEASTPLPVLTQLNPPSAWTTAIIN